MSLHRTEHSTSNAQRSMLKRWAVTRGIALGVECSMLNVECLRFSAEPRLISTRRQFANLSYLGEGA